MPSLFKQEDLKAIIDKHSHDTFARVFARLDPEKLEREFRNWVQTIAGKLSAQVIAIDGKTSRGSYDREKGIKDLQLVTADQVLPPELR